MIHTAMKTNTVAKQTNKRFYYTANTPKGIIALEIFPNFSTLCNSALEEATVLRSEESLIQNLEDWLNLPLDFSPTYSNTYLLDTNTSNRNTNTANIDIANNSIWVTLSPPREKADRDTVQGLFPRVTLHLPSDLLLKRRTT